MKNCVAYMGGERAPVSRLARAGNFHGGDEEEPVQSDSRKDVLVLKSGTLQAYRNSSLRTETRRPN